MYAQQKSRARFAPLKFEEGLGMLTRRVYFHMMRSAGRLMLPFAVTVEQFVVLGVLAEEDELTQQELVRRCASDARTMGKMLDGMEAKGWTQRTPHATDRRAWRIVLTARGRRLKEQMDEELVPLRKRAVEVLGETDWNKLKSLLASLSDGLDPLRWLGDDGQPRSKNGKRK
jgi:DNA-binding MarR family transcriptional regulator